MGFLSSLGPLMRLRFLLSAGSHFGCGFLILDGSLPLNGFLSPDGSLLDDRFLPSCGSLNIDGFLVRQGLLSSSGVLQDIGLLLFCGFLPFFGPLKYSVLIYACGLYYLSFLLLHHQECPVYVKSLLECAKADIALLFRIDVLLPPHTPGLLFVMLHLALKESFI